MKLKRSRAILLALMVVLVALASRPRAAATDLCIQECKNREATCLAGCGTDSNCRDACIHAELHCELNC